MAAIRLVWLAALLALLASCATNPVTGRPQLVLMSEAQEIAIGREAEPQIEASIGFYEDAELQRYVEGVALPMARRSERPALPWRFCIADDPAVNAFAVPGGLVCVTRGILAHMGSEAELASVLGHEIGHVTARHAVSQYTKQIGTSLVLLPAAILLPAELQGLGGQVLGAGLELLSLKYSRDDETQADELGLGYMVRAGYAPDEMVGMFETLDRAGRASGGEVPEWMLTHPNPGNRAQRIRERIARLPEEARSGRIGREDFLARVDGLVFGEDPRQGWFDAENVFHHPELGIRVRFPAGWRTLNQRTVVAAVSPDQDVAIQLDLVEADDPASAARAFASSEGLRASAPQDARVNGLPASTLEFVAPTSRGGTVRGRALFVALGERVYRLLGYGAGAGFAAQATAVSETLRSFARETDPAVLAVEPWRLGVVTPSRSLTQQEFAAAHPGPVDAATLARINGLDPGERYAAGVPVKRVVGRPLP